ncbi:MAG: leucine-rich repeat protein [Alistipes sp.]|nr:leucine-rich repeat protein [Alistipes sp.]
MKKFSLFALVVLLIGCTNDTSQDEQLADLLPIKISLEKSRANDTAFESGDQVGLYVVNYNGSTAGTLTSTENHINNACFTLSTDWRADEELYWKDASTKADFYAYYPYGNPTDVSAYPFSVNTDQSAEADYLASDFLWGKRSGVAPTKNAVTITTEHLLSNALVYIKAGEGYTAEELATADVEVKICNVKSNAIINLATGVATATGSATEITPWNTGAYYRAMIVPQTVSSDTNLVSVKINGKEYTFATDITFAAGTQHKIEVTISAPSNGLVASFSIKEWSLDDNIYSGEAIINPGAPMPANNEIWYTATEKVEPYKNDRFGANIVSNEWDETTSKGVITFDANVTSIGDWAFSRCSLTSITIPDSVTSFGVYAFYSCRSLTSITIPDSVTEIGGCAFSECCSLKTFYGKFASADNRCLIVDGVLTSFAPVGLTEYSIPGSVTSIGECAFAGCIDLTSVTIPNSVTSIGSRAFSKCSLTSITIPDSVTSFGNLAFSECLYMTSFYGKFASEDNCCLIVDGVLYSFAVGCDLTEYTIPNGVTEIGKNAFYSGYFLTNVNIPDSVTLIENSAFLNCISLTSVTIPDSVTAIGGSAFSKCSSLTSVTIGNSVTSIGDSVFFDCSNLASVTIGNNVSSIGKNAFSSCSSLTSVTIPNSVASIGGYAFAHCSSLMYVYCKPTTPPKGATSMFNSNASERKIYVPTASVEAYKAADGWKNYADYIEGYDF